MARVQKSIMTPQISRALSRSFGALYRAAALLSRRMSVPDREIRSCGAWDIDTPACMSMIEISRWRVVILGHDCVLYSEVGKRSHMIGSIEVALCSPASSGQTQGWKVGGDGHDIRSRLPQAPEAPIEACPWHARLAGGFELSDFRQVCREESRALRKSRVGVTNRSQDHLVHVCSSRTARVTTGVPFVTHPESPAASTPASPTR